jgi:hypothetical protein
LEEHSRFEVWRKQEWLRYSAQNKNGGRLSAARIFSQYFLKLL